MINQLLMLARAEAGEAIFRREAIDLSEYSRTLVEQLQPVAAAKGLRLETEIEDAVEVFGDSGWLERILLNLVDNAIKYTPSGGQVRFVLNRENATACIGIHDTGVGISRESLPHIFERFYRVDPARSKEVEGAGLGLSLVQWGVERHNGTISVESSLSVGTSFEVRLPLHIKKI